MKNLSQIEKVLLDQELKSIEGSLRKIGQDMIDVFKKYGSVKGQFGDDLKKYLVEKAICGNEAYFAGYSTEARVNVSTNSIPDELKKAILKFAIDDFVAKIDNVAEVADMLEEQS